MSELLSAITRFRMATSTMRATTTTTTAATAPAAAADEDEEIVPTPQQVGLFVTQELENAIARCKSKVETISRMCRQRNMRFRDSEFDLKEDEDRCLHSVDTNMFNKMSPAEALRVTQIFEKPEFYIDGASSGDIVQGSLGDCWFVSALAVVSSMPGLIEKICVARDEEVGVYGFIFYRDSGWVDVIIDDLLSVSVPRYESLTAKERSLYQNDKKKYDTNARKGGKVLFFARSGTENEVWVPLVEKAYAKLHGDYKSLEGGYLGEGVEDLTGGVATMIHTGDILDKEKFWNDELMFANKDRLFGGSVLPLNAADDGSRSDNVQGVFTSHAYSVLKAVKWGGKRFVVVRNPHGESEWNGPWSDGSKEWTPQWLPLLDVIGHKFGNDGTFVMEYDDFLATFSRLGRVRLFDESWRMSSQWLNVFIPPIPAVHSFGDVSYTFSLSQPSLAVIVLSQIDTRYFDAVSGSWSWTAEFVLYKKGDSTPLGRSQHAGFWMRSTNLEVELDSGDYVVHVRIDRETCREMNYVGNNVDNWNKRKFADTLAEAAKSQAIAANFDPSDHKNLLRPGLDFYAGKDLQELELATQSPLPGSVGKDSAGSTAPSIAPSTTTTTTTSTSSEIVIIAKDAVNGAQEADGIGKALPPIPVPEASGVPKDAAVHEGITCDNCKIYPVVGIRYKCIDSDCPDFDLCAKCIEMGVHPKEHAFLRLEVPAKPGAFAPPPEKQEDDDDEEEQNPNKPVVAHPIMCNECRTSPIMGSRYKCLDTRCPDYDLCAKCMNAGLHPKDHVMLRMDTLEQDAKLARDDNSGPDADVLLGLKVYTRNVVTEVQGQLRHGNVISWSKPSSGPIAA